MAVTVNGMPVPEELIAHEAEMMRERLYEAMRGEPRDAIERRLAEWATENAIEKVLVRQAALADPEAIADEAIELAAKKGTDGSAEDERNQRILSQAPGADGDSGVRASGAYREAGE
jgi:hypothetical protein